MAVRAEQVSEERAVAIIALGMGGGVAGASGLDDVRVDGPDREPGVHQGINDHARGTFDGDLHGRRRATLTEPAEQLGQGYGRVWDRAAPLDGPGPRVLSLSFRGRVGQ
jgi:hypothetical protein